MTICFSQRDEKWKFIKRYHQSASDSLQGLDESIRQCLKKKSDSNQKEAWEAFGHFTQAISDLIENGLNNEKGTSGYSVFDYGCWDCAIAMVIANFNAKVYIYDKRNGKDTNPATFIDALRSWQILSPIGFYYDIFIDPISIITKGKVQLYLHEDYGKDGENAQKATVFQDAISLGDKVGIAVCVKGHPSLGIKTKSHWVYIDPQSITGDIKMFDPDKPANKKTPSKFTYKKIYEVCVYSTRGNIEKF